MRDINTFLPFWEGFSVVAIKPDGDALQIDLIPQATRFPTCGGCQKLCSTTHEYCDRVVRDLPILGRAVRLNVQLRRVSCRDCGKRMEVVSWLDRYARMTRRLAEAVIQACERLPTLHVAQMFGLHWDTVRLLERRALQAALSALPKAQPRRLIMDEFALFKGHRYASVVLDADTRRVLWIGEGRSRAAVRPFFEELGPEGCARIEAVAMDMNTAYDL
ncbi:ISL3 family transposase, partial [Pseudomonas veronii]